MKNPPRSLGTRLFSGRDLLRSFLQGGLVLLTILFTLQYIYPQSTNTDGMTRALGFVILATCNMGLIFADMSGGSLTELARIFRKRSNIVILTSFVAFLTLLLQVPQIRKLFRFEPLSSNQILVAVGLSIGTFILISIWNRFSPRVNKTPPPSALL